MTVVSKKLSRPRAKPTKTADAERRPNLSLSNLDSERSDNSKPVEVMTAQQRHEQRRDWFIAEASKQAGNRAQALRVKSF